MLWILFSILAALAHSIVSILDKFILSRLVDKPVVPVMISGLVGLAAGGLIFLVQGFPPLSWFNIMLALLAGLASLAGLIPYFIAIKEEEKTRPISLYYTSPLFVMVLAWVFLGEVFTQANYLGIFLIVAGAILISLKRPLHMSFGKSFWLIMFSTFAYSVYGVIMKYLLNYADFWTVFAYGLIGTFLGLIPAYLLYHNEIGLNAKKYGRKSIGMITMSESLTIAGMLFFIIAASFGYVTLVDSMTTLQPFFVLAFAVFLSLFYPHILKEEIDRQTLALKIAAIALIFIGALMIV